MNVMEDILINLYYRWQDEKDYEDFKDYIDKMKRDFDTEIKENYMMNAVFVKASQKPFGITFDFEGWRIVLSVNSQHVKWKAKRI